MRERLRALTEPVLQRLGYELVDCEYVPGRRQAVLRFFIDRPQGVGLEDCERASHELGSLLEAEDPVPSAYRLEVSSPGLDRVLRTPEHFRRFLGARVHVQLRVAREGRRRYTGRLESLGPQGIELSVDGAMVSVPFTEIERARLAPQWG